MVGGVVVVVDIFVVVVDTVVVPDGVETTVYWVTSNST